MRSFLRGTFRPSAVLVPLALAGGCASTSSQQAATLAGCYYFERTDVAESLRLPWGVRLASAPLDGWPALQQREGVRLATTLTGTVEADHPFGYWIPSAEGEVEIGYPAGGGMLLELRPEGQELVGTVRSVGDVVAPGAAADPTARPVRLTRARCPEE